MSEIIQSGYHVQLVNRSTNIIVFSAATSELTKQGFITLWSMIGETVYSGMNVKQRAEFELRVTPLM